MLHARVRHVLEDEGFSLNPKKGRVQAQSAQQQVTGVVVNQKTSVDRKAYRNLRALLHQAQHKGLESQNVDKLPHFRRHLEGHVAYISMVDANKGRRLREALEKVKN